MVLLVAVTWWVTRDILSRAPDGTLVDLDVYRQAGDALLAGGAVYEAPGRALVFTYPPIAAVLAVVVVPFQGWWGQLAWIVATVAATVAVAGLAFRPAIQRATPAARPLVLAALGAGIVSMFGMQVHLDYGQVNVLLCLLCLLDVLPGEKRWPPGMLVGFATALKLTPGVFIIYLFVVGRWRAGATAVGAFVAATAVGALMVPGGGWEFWTGTVFDTTRVAGDVGYLSNQSLLGSLHRMVGEGAAGVLWPFVALAVVAFALVKARRLHQGGDVRGAVGIVALLPVLVSPIAWFHHLIWLVPAVAALAGDLRDRRRVALAAAAALALWFPLPTWTPLLQNADTVIALALLVAYPSPLARRADPVPDEPILTPSGAGPAPH